MKLTIGHLYPDLLNLYGDKGNISCMQRRLEWRGIHVAIKPVISGERIDLSGLDLVLLGGGQDREQELVCRYMMAAMQDFKAYVEDGGVVLAICGGYQMLGNYYRTSQTMIEGFGILDIYTKWEPKRLTGNIILDSPLSKTCVVGFENHGGRTYIGKHIPFGRVIMGFGNTGKPDGKSGGESCYEGVIYKNVIGTYLHGPLLPKNPEICDFLLEKALKRKYGEAAVLGQLPDELEHKANRYLVTRLFLSGIRV